MVSPVPFHVAVLAFSPFTDMDLFVPLDLLGRSGVPGWSVTLVSDEPAIAGSTGVEVKVQGGLEALASADFVLVVSGRGVRRALATPAVLEAMAPRNLPKVRGVGSLDSGALLLAASGWLEGSPATTYPTARRELEAFGVRYVASPLVTGEAVVQGRRVPLATAGGCLSSVPLAAWILERFAARDVADRVVASAASVGLA